jgi:hypothetical protein
MTDSTHQKHHDSDLEKGAVSSDRPESSSDVSMTGQLGHRDEDEMIKEGDTDFPEPDAQGEHSGE